MPAEPLQALRAAQRAMPPTAARPRLLIAGATGALGNEVVRRLVGSGRFASTEVLAREPITTGLRGVSVRALPPGPIAEWTKTAADVAVVMFDPPRLYYDRERALWTPEPAQLAELGGWLRGCGVHTVAIVMPHAQGRLPDALKRGLASLDEHAVAALGFTRLLFIRSAQKPAAAARRSFPERTAHWMLSVTRFMVPSSEQPVRAAKVAELLAVALELAPPGIHVAAPETVWEAAQGELRSVAARWLTR